MSSTVDMWCPVSKQKIIYWFWNPITFSWDVDFWQDKKRKITKYYHISIRVLHLITKLISAILKTKEREWSHGETSKHLVSLKSPECALYRTSRHKTVTCKVSEKVLKHNNKTIPSGYIYMCDFRCKNLQVRLRFFFQMIFIRLLRKYHWTFVKIRHSITD